MGIPAKEQQYFRPRNWNKFQGYKKRGPKWIRLYPALLRDPDFIVLTEIQQLSLIKLWLHYAAYGRPFPVPPARLGRGSARARKHLASVFSAAPQHVGRIFDALLFSNFIELCGESVADSAIPCDTLAPPDTDTDTEKKEPPAPNGADPPKPKRKIGTRLPADWMPGEPEISFARTLGLSDEQIRETADEFRDYWTSESGRGAAKLSWTGTWRNRLRYKFGNGAGGNTEARQPKPKNNGRAPAGYVEAALRVLDRTEDAVDVPERPSGIQENDGVVRFPVRRE